MKTLDQVAPGTPISTPNFTITQPGYYFLTGNITATSTRGIRISSDGVTLDLRGFTVSAPSTLDGVSLSDDCSRVTVRNGTVQGARYGIYLDRTKGCIIEDVTVENSTEAGIYLDGVFGASEGNIIRRSTVRMPATSSGWGIHLSGSSASVCSSNLISGCTVQCAGATGKGILLQSGNGNCENNIVENCAVGGSPSMYIWAESGQCSGNIVRDSTFRGGPFILEAANGSVSSTSLSGLSLQGMVKFRAVSTGSFVSNVMRRCQIQAGVPSATDYALHFENAGGGNVFFNGNSIEETDISPLTASAGGAVTVDNPGATGFANGMIFRRCNFRNFGRGIFINGSGLPNHASGGVIQDCVGTDIGNLGISITGNNWRVEGNHVTGRYIAQSTGLSIPGFRNAIFRNTMGAFTTHYSIVNSNLIGPVINITGTLADTGPQSHPLANFVME